MSAEATGGARIAPDDPVGASLRLAPRVHAWMVASAVLATGAALGWLTWALVKGASLRSGAQSVEAIGHFMMASALGAWVCARAEIRRRGLAPTSDERFSWLDFPARRAAYETQVASRLPVALRLMESFHKPLFFGGYALLVLSEPVAHLLGWYP